MGISNCYNCVNYYVDSVNVTLYTLLISRT